MAESINSSERQRLLQLLLKQKGISEGAGARFRRRSTPGPAPMSFLQEGLWFLDKLDPGKATYNVPGAARLRGPLVVSAFEAAFAEIVRRHEALRTTFGLRNGQPVQIVGADAFKLNKVDLGSILEPDRFAEASRFATAEARTSFDLEQGPVFRAHLLKLAADDHVFVFNIHHIVTDGWSMGVLTREFIELYRAFSSGRPSPLAELPLQYSDYASWQREEMQGDTLQSHLNYWTRKLCPPLPPLNLPLDHPRPAYQTGRGSHQTVRFSKPLTSALRLLAQREGATLFATMLSAFGLLLQHFSGQQDVIVGSPAANRARREFEQLIGYFVNMVPMRLDLSGNPTFRELLKRVQTVTVEAYAHQDLPFPKIVSELKTERDPSRNPVFQAEFTLLAPEHAPAIYGYGFRSPIRQNLQVGDLVLEPIDVESGVSKFDLVMLLWDIREGISGTLEYNADLFEARSIEKMIAVFERLLTSIVAYPDYPLDRHRRLLGDPPAQSIAVETGVRTMEQNETKTETTNVRPGGVSASRRPMARRKAVPVSEQNWVNMRSLFDGPSGPLLLEPALDGVDLAAWAGQKRALIDEKLLEHRALLFRNFDISKPAQFNQFVRNTSDGELLEYVDRTTPRTTVEGRIYTSTVYPSDQRIHLHNEGTYWSLWPLKLYFCCIEPAQQGGQTPIADVRNVLQRLRPEVVDKFRAKKFMLVRNYNDGFGLPWQEVFQTTNKDEVEEYCRQKSIEFEWKDGGRLRTRQVRPAVRVHPRTGEHVWFNHAAFFHYTTLEPQVRDSLLEEFGEDGLPYNTYYGDGTPIELPVVEEVREAYRQEKRVFSWQSGDILLLDNMSFAHARESYVGSRTVLAAMAEPYAGDTSS